jgi:hypothetical protein
MIQSSDDDRKGFVGLIYDFANNYLVFLSPLSPDKTFLQVRVVCKIRKTES